MVVSLKENKAFLSLVRANPIEALFWAIWTIYFLVLRGTPLSFGKVYEILGYPSPNLVGKSQDIRSDEWSVTTPRLINFLQNGKLNLNQHSPIHESFNSVLPLPTLEPKILMQPIFWGFHFFGNSWGLAFYWSIAFACYFFFMRKLLLKLGISRFFANFGTVSIFFTSFQQTWMNDLGFDLLFFPFLIFLLTIARSRVSSRIVIAYFYCAYVLMSRYILDLTYLFILVGLLLLFLVVKGLLTFRGACYNLIAALTGVFFGLWLLRSDLVQLQETVYPGQRWAENGNVPLAQWLAQFIPNLTFSGWTNLVGPNVCEASLIDTGFPLLAIICILFNFRRFFAMRSKQLNLELSLFRFPELILLAGFVFLSVWQLISLPSWIGVATTLGRSGANRTLGVSGWLLVILSLLVLSKFQLEDLIKAKVITAWIVIATGVPLAYRLHSLTVPFDYSKFFSEDLLYTQNYLLPVTFLLLFLAVWVTVKISVLSRLIEQRGIINLVRVQVGRDKLLIASVLLCSNLALWGTYNPILSSDKVFQLRDTSAGRNVEAYFSTNPKPVIVPITGAHAWFQSIGINTPQNYYLLPPIDFWKKLLVDNFDTYSNVVNRMGYLEVGDVAEPTNGAATEVIVPISLFPESSFSVASFRPKTKKDKIAESFSIRVWCQEEGDVIVDAFNFRKMESKTTGDVSIQGWIPTKSVGPISVEVKQEGNSKLRIKNLNRGFRTDVLRIVGFTQSVSGYSTIVSNVVENKCLQIIFSELN